MAAGFTLPKQSVIASASSNISNGTTSAESKVVKETYNVHVDSSVSGNNNGVPFACRIETPHLLT
jgi:hypothetical protein